MPQDELLSAVLTEGILRGTDDRPVLHVDGTPARWMLDTLNLSLTARGSRLAAQGLLKVLKTFEGRHLATYGTTGIPLMQAVIAESKGRYSGLIVRKDVKTYGARLRIQGPPVTGPVIVLDDSIASGDSIRACRAHLEDAGHDVEGAVVLVRFGYNGVAVLLEEDGFRVESVLDTDFDLRPRMTPPEDLPMLNPTKWIPDFRWSKARAAEGLHPAVLARQVLTSYLRDGSVPRPPRRLDRAYDGTGGVYVSLRLRADIHERPARGGMWHFPEDARAPLPEELINACILTAHQLKDPSLLDACAVAVTFFSALEPCPVGALDNDRYGIVVRSRVRRGIMGGALPRMPGIRDGWAQFRHAAFKNGQLYRHEPFELLRHDVVKVVEPGEPWQLTGVPKDDAPLPIDRAIAEQAHAWVAFHLKQGPRPAPSGVPLAGIDQLYVSPYLDGAVVGCSGDVIRAETTLDALLDTLAVSALHDPRFPAPTAGALTVVVSVLRLDLALGQHEATTVMAPTKFAKQALEVSQGDKVGVLLPYVVVTQDFTPQEYADAVVEKAGLTEGPLDWTRFNCASWVVDANGARPLLDGLPARTPKDGDPRVLGGLWAEFLARHSTRAHEEAVNRYLPFADQQSVGVAPERLAHSAWVKARVGLKREAEADLARLALDDASLPTVAFAALALHALGKKRAVAPLVERLRAFRPPVGAADREEDLDYAPGQILYALAVVDPHADVDAVLGHYRRRFRARPAWGSVAWLTMACAAWSRVKRDPALLDFAWDIAQWALQSQAADGGFWNDQQDDAPGAITGVYLEGFAVLLAELRRARRARPAAVLDAALRRGYAFLARLTYLPGDAGILPNPAFALGGVRMSLTSGEVRLDFVQHALSAVLSHP